MVNTTSLVLPLPRRQCVTEGRGDARLRAHDVCCLELDVRGREEALCAIVVEPGRVEVARLGVQVAKYLQIARLFLLQPLPLGDCERAVERGECRPWIAL